MRTRLTVGVLLVVLAGYLGFAAWKGARMVAEGSAAGVVLGLAVLAVPLVGGWAVWRELTFGRATQQLADELAAAGRWPTDELPTRPSGRPDRAAADAVFEQRRREVEADEDDWGAWFRLGLAYEDAGDRRRARGAMRRAVALHS